MKDSVKQTKIKESTAICSFILDKLSNRVKTTTYSNILWKRGQIIAVNEFFNMIKILLKYINSNKDTKSCLESSHGEPVILIYNQPHDCIDSLAISDIKVKYEGSMKKLERTHIDSMNKKPISIRTNKQLKGYEKNVNKVQENIIVPLTTVIIYKYIE